MQMSQSNMMAASFRLDKDVGQLKMTPKIRCQICQTISENQSALVEHMHLHHREEFSFFCYQCGKGFKSYSGLHDHQKTYHVSGKNVPTCEICGKVFARNSRLIIHKRSHSNERPFVCLKCGKSYKHKQHLKDHICSD